MDNDLQALLQRRKDINRGRIPAPTKDVNSDESKTYHAIYRSFNVHQEFPELGHAQTKKFEKLFKSHDSDHKGYLTVEDCKKLMEELGKPQTHLGLKKMIQQATEEEQGKTSQQHPANTLSFYGFLSIFAGSELEDEETSSMNPAGSGIKTRDLARASEVNVHQTGVSGAKNFFSAKINQQSRANQAAEEIKAAQAARKLAEIRAQERKNDFKNRINMFNN